VTGGIKPGWTTLNVHSRDEDLTNAVRSEVALMLSEFLLYLVGILATVGGILLLERIVAGARSTAGTGYARMDSAFDLDRLRGSATAPE
jgi:hypothetical protein